MNWYFVSSDTELNGKGFGADVESLVPLQDHWQRFLHLFGVNYL